MGEQKKGLMAAVERLTEQLTKSWDTIGAVLAGRIRMHSITLQSGDLLLVYDDAAATGHNDALAAASNRLAQMLAAKGTNVLVLVVPHNVEFEAFNQEILEAHGWQRAPQAAAPTAPLSATVPPPALQPPGA